jgi:streptogramin lyase
MNLGWCLGCEDRGSKAMIHDLLGTPEDNLKKLTPSQRKLLALRGQGYSNEDIAAAEPTDPVNIRRRISYIYRKLGWTRDVVEDNQRQLAFASLCDAALSAGYAAVEETLATLDMEDPPEPENNPPHFYEEGDGVLSAEDIELLLADNAVLRDELAATKTYPLAVVPRAPDIIDVGWEEIPAGRKQWRRRIQKIVPVFLLVALVGTGTFFVGRTVGLSEHGAVSPSAVPTVMISKNGIEPGAEGVILPTATATAPRLPLTATATLLSDDSTVATATPPAPTCAEEGRTAATPFFDQIEGLSLFSRETTNQAVPSNLGRTLEISDKGLWIGYFEDAGFGGGVGHYDKLSWAICGLPEGNVNDMVVDKQGRLWVALESQGVAMFDGTNWQTFTMANGLPALQTFGLTVDEAGDIWVATLAGVARYNGAAWETVYHRSNDTSRFNNSHAFAVDHEGNIWVGHINDGVSAYIKEQKAWVLFQKAPDSLGGNKIRSILVQQQEDGTEDVWFATADGGLSVYADKEWRTYGLEDGLPSISINEVDVDPKGRIWVATDAGVSYLQDGRWVRYHTFPARSIAFGCDSCLIDEDHVWTATWGHGLTHSRLPYIDEGATVTEICLAANQRERECVLEPEVIWEGGEPTVAVAYSQVLHPGESLQIEMYLAPVSPSFFLGDRGDKLISRDARSAEVDKNLEWTIYHMYQHITPTRKVAGGEPYRFAQDDDDLIVPALPDGVTEQRFTSSWRMWMYTREAGPIINIHFLVQASKDLQTPTP